MVSNGFMANHMVPMAQLTRRPLTWLWQGRLALGKLAMFDGDPARAKSLVTLDLCARITTGRPMPDGTGGGQPENAVIILGEDVAEDTVVPRLQALGADLGRIFVFASDFLAEQGPFRLPVHARILGEQLEIHQPRLLVIDPITAMLEASINANHDQSVRAALSPLVELADHHRCAVILVRHLNKIKGSHAMYRGGGSIAFNAACRSSWLFDFDPNDASRLIMAQIKNNLAPLQPSLAFRLVQQEAADHKDAPPTLEWLGPSSLTAEQLLTRTGAKPGLGSAHDRAWEFLPAFLENGPRPTGEIWDAARQQNLQRRVLQIVRRELGILSRRVWTGDKQLTYWYLPGAVDFPMDEFDKLIAYQQARFPPDPLDDGLEGEEP